MSSSRGIRRLSDAAPTLEGAGVSLLRVFGFYETEVTDPFLLLDDFHSENPDDYIAGFPWHPHRGIKTVTYMLAGRVEHGDSIGNKGVIGSGDVQWMTAGSGIIHQEMPAQTQGLLQGFQLWVNLPKNNKMMGPRYRDVKAESIPEAALADGVSAKVISGHAGGVQGPVRDIVVDVNYLDVNMEADVELEHSVKEGHTLLAYVFQGAGEFGAAAEKVKAGRLILFEDGDSLEAAAGGDGVRFLLAQGEPLNEPVAWRGPIVMNTEDELDKAFREYSTGTFIKDGGRVEDTEGSVYYGR